MPKKEAFTHITKTCAIRTKSSVGFKNRLYQWVKKTAHSIRRLKGEKSGISFMDTPDSLKE